MLSRLASRSLAVCQPATSTALVVRQNASSADTKPVSSSGSTDLSARPVRGEVAPVRLGFIPEEWFQFFHPKTGVTGPYMFGIGLSTYLMSKEIYVMEHEYYSGLSIAIMVYFACTKLAPSIASWLDKEVDEYEASWNKGRKDTIAALEEAVKTEKKMQWQALGQELLIQAKKENILLQLEAEYRERMMKVYNEVKRRLDYQVAKSAAERRIAQRHMVDWVVTNVRKAITPEQDKQTIDRCIADLSAIAVKH